MSKITTNIKRFLTHPYLTLFSRITLGGIFIFAGIAKFNHTGALVADVFQYHILSDSLSTAYAHALPTVEIVVGVLLVLGVLQRVTASVGGLLCLSFIIAKIVAYAQGLDVHICGCFGPAVPLHANYTLALNFVMLALAIQIVLHQGEFLSVDGLFLRLIKSKKSTKD
jgi:uncharacterized membrane protein YphA (DoxX/SURF4 family)